MRIATGIARRTMLLAWTITLITLGIFVAIIVPEQKRDLRAGLESKAAGVAVALQGEVAEAAVSEDYSSVVEHAMQVLKGDKSVDFLVITKNDGLSLVVDRNGWRMEMKTDRYWFPELRRPSSELGVVPMFNRRVFHYAVPFDYSSIQWGWIHVGLSLDSYDESARQVNLRTGILSVVCVLISLIASFLYAGRFVRPILQLQSVVERVASGDLMARADIRGRDEIAQLAKAFNGMADTIQHRDQELSDAKHDLEMRVLERTAELEKEVRERTAAEAQMRSAKEAAEIANHAKSDFLANMSHEIRTPLNGVIGMTALALEAKPDEQQREYLETIQLSAESLLTVINDILDFSKIEAGKMDMESVEFSLRTCLEDALTPLAIYADQKGLELLCDIAPDVPELVQADPMRLRQIVVNLVGNAIKFTRSGEVVVRAQLSNPEDGPRDVQFTVADTGIGIPADKQETIFAPFAQVDTSTTRRYGGTGLGLTICSRLVSVMGGKIWLDSQLGRGSRFHFTARLKFPAGNSGAEVHQASIDLRGVRILIVDDNTTNRRILREMLSRREAKTCDVESGEQALAELLSGKKDGHPYDLILTDMHMPKMDGMGLIERIRSTPGLRATAIMMLTSATHQDNVQRCRELGVTCYLLKPVRQWELLAAISTALDKDALPPLAAASTERTMPPRGGLCILLAEDNAINQRVAAKTLESMGHTVVMANNGMDALSLMAKHPVDLVLMDIQMPEMDGFTATRQIRHGEIPGKSNIPIVAMTAHNMKGDRERCIAAGMDDYLSKPINRKELEKAIAGARRVKLNNGGVADDEGRRGPSAIEHAHSWDAGQALERVGGDEELLFEVVEIFLNEAPHALIKLRRALSSGDSKAVERIAHGLKGEIGYLGIRTLSQMARELEEAGRKQDLMAAEPLLASLETEIPYVVRAVRQACSVMQERRQAEERGARS